jgi:ribonucleoside-diphosphate reductase protein NrdI
VSNIKIVYDSLTGLSKKFAIKLNEEAKSVEEFNESGYKVFLVTRTEGFGNIPKTTLDFVENYKDLIIGTAVSGNMNWGSNYGAAGNKIRETYNIPLIRKFEASGLKEDVKFVKDYIENYEENK